MKIAISRALPPNKNLEVHTLWRQSPTYVWWGRLREGRCCHRPGSSNQKQRLLMWRVDGQPPCPVTNKENIALVHVKYNLNVWFLLQGNAHVLRCHHCRKMVTKYRYSHSGYLYIYIHISMNPYRVTPLLCNGAVALSDLYMLPRTCLWNRASSVSV